MNPPAACLRNQHKKLLLQQNMRRWQVYKQRRGGEERLDILGMNHAIVPKVGERESLQHTLEYRDNPFTEAFTPLTVKHPQNPQPSARPSLSQNRQAQRHLYPLARQRQ